MMGYIGCESLLRRCAPLCIFPRGSRIFVCKSRPTFSVWGAPCARGGRLLPLARDFPCQRALRASGSFYRFGTGFPVPTERQAWHGIPFQASLARELVPNRDRGTIRARVRARARARARAEQHHQEQQQKEQQKQQVSRPISVMFESVRPAFRICAWFFAWSVSLVCSSALSISNQRGVGGRGADFR